MDEALFWSLMARLDWEKLGDDDAVLHPLVQALSRLPEIEIFRFDDILAEKLYALDGEAYAREIGGDAYGTGKYFSPDLFLYARCCAIANGRDFFLAVLADPTRMPRNKEFEALLYAGAQAYEKKTGRGYEHAPQSNIETGSNPVGWPGLARLR
jgi:hypothetical protein